MQNDSGNLRLTEKDWEFIFKSLELSRSVFSNNPVVQDVMEEHEIEFFVDSLSAIMDKIGYNGGKAARQYPSSSSSSSKSSSSSNSSSSS